MSLLSGLFTELEKAPAPRFVLSENVERTTAPAEQLDQRQQPGAERTPKCKKRPTAPIHTPQPVADPDQPKHFIQTAVTASPEWRHARDQYINHLMTCRGCYAPVSRYCAAGAKLRQRYDRAPMSTEKP
ncbi:hypothetical protein [Pseudomonas marincola]|uniref:hypothetical protein n=1 Tax=Pseudomonas marincola TaxID=437900 RepID=UPI00113073BC|nr:hypothetical protein [Pseudomonas marincola]